MPSFTLKTWNCFGLPQGLLALLRAEGPPSAHRFRHATLGTTIEAAEIVCLQELWMAPALRLFERLPHPHKLRDQSGMKLRPPTLVGSGLAIASRFPIVESSLALFSPPFSGADRLARKGMLHARLRVRETPRLELDLLDLHSQAQRGNEPAAVRAKQMAELAARIEAVGAPERPFFLCGDFNLNGLAERRADEYDALVKLLPGFVDLGAAEDRPTFHPQKNALAQRFFPNEPDQRLDYIFYRPAARGPRLVLGPLTVALDRPLDASEHGPAVYASDHYALTVRVDAE